MKIRLFTIPNMLTLSNLICGSLATHAVIANQDYTLAFGLIILAAAFDFCDGFAARLLKQSSPLGVELDSLADMVSFGVAPAMVMSGLIGSDTWIGYIPYLIVAMSALRLAKFNIDTEQSCEFIGLPTPACALACVSIGLLHDSGVVIDDKLIAIIAIVLAALLISPIRMFALKFKNYSIKDNALRYSFIVAALLLLIIKPLFAMPAIIALYILVSTIVHFTRE